MSRSLFIATFVLIASIYCSVPLVAHHTFTIDPLVFQACENKGRKVLHQLLLETCTHMDPNKHHTHDALVENYKSFKVQFPKAVHSSKTNCVGILNVDNTAHLDAKI